MKVFQQVLPYEVEQLISKNHKAWALHYHQTVLSQRKFVISGTEFALSEWILLENWTCTNKLLGDFPAGTFALWFGWGVSVLPAFFESNAWTLSNLFSQYILSKPSTWVHVHSLIIHLFSLNYLFVSDYIYLNMSFSISPAFKLCFPRIIASYYWILRQWMTVIYVRISFILIY